MDLCRSRSKSLTATKDIKLKTCRTCKKDKPLAAFSKHSKKPDGYQTECKDCKNSYNRNYYAKDRTAQYNRVKVRNAAQKTLLKEYVWTLKRNPCTDCGQSYHPFVMDFDHIGDDKVYNIYEMVHSGYSLETVKAEIAKCELVCANCHRLRTGIRAGIIAL